MPVQFTTALPDPSSASTTVVADGENISLSWTRNDSTSVGGHDIERSDDGGGSWSTVASGLSAITTSYTDSTVANGSTYEYRVQRYTDDASSYSNETSPLRVPLRLTRKATISGGGTIAAIRGELTKTRQRVLAGDGALRNERVLSKPRVNTLVGAGAVSTLREGITKSRTTTLDGGGALTNTAIFKETFASELTRDLEWDYIRSELGFRSEWIAKYPGQGHGSFAAYLDGRLETGPLHVVIEYDADGDDQPDERSRVATVSAMNEVVIFPSLSGDAGRYRVIVRDLRPQDVFSAVTFGTTHT